MLLIAFQYNMATSKIQQKEDSSGFVNNWQAGKSLAECNLRMLDSQDCCDVTFRCGERREVIGAHRYVLISRSCVFYAMFVGPLAKETEVDVPEIELDYFKQFIK